MKEVNVSFKYPADWIVSYSLPQEGLPLNHSAIIKGAEGEIELTWGGDGYGGGCPKENVEKMVILETEQEVCHYKGRLSSNDENWFVLTNTKNGQALQFGITLYNPSTESSIFAQNFLNSFVYNK